MRYFQRILTMPGILALLLVFGRPAAAQRTSYSHVTAVEGSVSVISDANGRTEGRVNLPLSTGEQVTTQAGARAEIELADGNRIQLAGESHLQLQTLAGEDGSDAAESAVNLMEGSLAAESIAADESRAFRIDTADATVYMPQEAMARINLDPGRGTSVIVRQGSVEVQTRTGSKNVEAGSYLLVRGEEEPVVERGSFSRDRFDIWVSERTDTILQAYNSTASRYVEKDYETDAADLDNYGEWDYSPTYQTTVWRPSVAADWSPYSDGYWYYTPAGSSWVSYEPWGWFPYHYGNWFFDAAFGGWCWSPAYVYSPAWVYWAYSPFYVGWCPIGYYSYYGPYCNYWGYGSLRRGLYISLTGVFNPARIDLRKGWNFVGAGKLGSTFSKSALLSGGKLAGRLGGSLAITSSPLKVAGKIVSGTQAMRSYATAAPKMISAKSSATANASLTPYLARQKSLPDSTLSALKSSGLAKIEPGRRTLTGPGASGLPVASKNTASASPSTTKLSGGFGTSNGENWRSAGKGTVPAAPSRSFTSQKGPDWRSQGRPSASSSPKFTNPGAVRQPLTPRGTEKPAAPRSDWRNRAESAPGRSQQQPLSPRKGQAAPAAPEHRTFAPPDRTGDKPRAAESWRNRPGTPPAQRVIEGIDRGRAVPPPRPSRPMTPKAAPERNFQQPYERRYQAPAPRYSAPPERRYEAPAPRYTAPPERRYETPAPRYSAPSAPRYEAPRQSPAPHYEAPRQSPSPHTSNSNKQRRP
jgi:hypothetical protein